MNGYGRLAMNLFILAQAAFVVAGGIGGGLVTLLGILGACLLVDAVIMVALAVNEEDQKRMEETARQLSERNPRTKYWRHDSD